MLEDRFESVNEKLVKFNLPCLHIGHLGGPIGLLMLDSASLPCILKTSAHCLQRQRCLQGKTIVSFASDMQITHSFIVVPWFSLFSSSSVNPNTS